MADAVSCGHVECHCPARIVGHHGPCPVCGGELPPLDDIDRQLLAEWQDR